MVEVVENGLRRWGEREKYSAIERAVTCRKENCFPGPVDFIFNGIPAFVEDEQAIHRSPAQSSRIF